MLVEDRLMGARRRGLLSGLAKRWVWTGVVVVDVARGVSPDVP